MSVYLRMAIGLMVMLFFSLVLLVVIPAYVEKPAFIPGFAPGPDMWPRTISIIGIGVGILYMLFQLSDWKRRVPLEGGWLVATRMYWVRSLVCVSVLLCYVALVPVLGIVLSSTLLLAVLYALLGKPHPMLWMIGLTVAFPYALYWLFSTITTTLFPMGTLWESIGF